MAGGLEQGGWGLGRVSKGLGGWGLDEAEGLGGGLDPRGTGRTLVRLFGRLFGRSDVRKFPPLFYRTSSPLGPLPKKYLLITKPLPFHQNDLKILALPPGLRISTFCKKHHFFLILGGGIVVSLKANDIYACRNRNHIVKIHCWA